MFICVYCSSSLRIDQRYLDLARDLGGHIAARGHTLVSGGAKISCMGAVTSGARAAGGRTVGVIPRALMDVEIADDASDELIVTADMRERKGVMDARSDAFVVLPGGIGTLEELFEIWTARVIGLHERPLVILDPWGFYDPLRDMVTSMYDKGFTRPDVFDAITWASTPEEAVDRAEARTPRITTSAEELAEAE
ncbi:TIGR00730 family Rossman fold protein [Spongiactinospora sp. TRM90649]|uniref:LOG family protein n=1 Tax=Spongiactinospora sp. TRM90649 TaxID=3031114 RepID=UPI0023F704C1|nr:TIGR00730 family Rossman fold protein [Spongiactinospora sp. TRM90649]MDF5755448.1 TIGR00730 family Rossman fold protein [Spongiactinospora sp. TRM90649]